MRFLMLVALLLTAMSVAAQNWVDVTESADVVHYIDPGTIRSNGHLRRVWEIMDYRQRQRSGAMSTRLLAEYDCKEDRYRILSISRHSDQMARGQVIDSLGEPSAWDYIAPGTVVATKLKTVCAVRK